MRREVARDKAKSPQGNSGFQWRWKLVGGYVLATGILTFLLNAPSWDIQIAFQGQANPAQSTSKALNSSLLQPAQPWLRLDTETFFNLQPLALSESTVVQKVQSAMAQENLGKWTQQKLKQAINTQISPQARQLTVTVHTPDLNASERLATHLKYAYQKSLQNYQQAVVTAQQSLVEEAMLSRAAQREVAQKWAEATLQVEDIDAFYTPANLKAIGGQKLQHQYTRLDALAGAYREILATTPARQNFYLDLLPKSTRKAVLNRLNQADSKTQTHVDKLASTTLEALLLPLQSVNETPEWLGMQDEVATAAYELSLDSAALNDDLITLIPTSGQTEPQKALLQALAENHLQYLLAQKGYILTQTALEATLKDINQLSTITGTDQVWSLQRDLLDGSVNALAREMDRLNPGQTMPLTLKDTGIVRPYKQYHTLMWLGSWLCLLGLPWGLSLIGRKLSRLRFNRISTMSWSQLLQTLSQSPKPEITLVLPQLGEHAPQVALNLSDSLTRSGRHTLVIDVDVYQRELSMVFPEAAAHGLLHHMLDNAMAQPYTLPGQDANLIPIEATLHSATSGNFRQILSRLPQVWQRWPKSHIVLDASRWYPVYESLLPYLARVITYPPQTTQTGLPALTTPWELLQKKGVTITRLDSIPAKLNAILDQPGLNRLDRSLNPVVDR